MKDLPTRMAIAESRIANIESRTEEDRKATKEYRDKIDGKLDYLIKLGAIGLGIVSTLQILMPYLLKK